MLRKLLVIIAIAAVCIFCLSSCKKRSDEAKTTAEYEAEAKEEITKENIDEELGKLEKAVEEETSPQK